MVLDGYPTLSSFVDTPKGVWTMDRIVSTIILVTVSVALAVALSTYYTGLVIVFMRYEEISFDLAYAALRDGGKDNP